MSHIKCPHCKTLIEDHPPADCLDRCVYSALVVNNPGFGTDPEPYSINSSAAMNALLQYEHWEVLRFFGKFICKLGAPALSRKDTNGHADNFALAVCRCIVLTTAFETEYEAGMMTDMV